MGHATNPTDALYVLRRRYVRGARVYIQLFPKPLTALPVCITAVVPATSHAQERERLRRCPLNVHVGDRFLR
jgi:hypothetical protein